MSDGIGLELVIALLFQPGGAVVGVEKTVVGARRVDPVAVAESNEVIPVVLGAALTGEQREMRDLLRRAQHRIWASVQLVCEREAQRMLSQRLHRRHQAS